MEPTDKAAAREVHHSNCQVKRTMEDPIPDTTPADSWTEQFNRSLEEHRNRARQFLGDHRQQFEQTQQTLLSQLSELGRQLSSDEGDVDSQKTDIEHQQASIEAMSEDLKRRESELEQRDIEWNSLRDSVTQQQNMLTDLFNGQQATLDDQRQTQDAETQQLAARREDIVRREAALQTLVENQALNEQEQERRQQEIADSLQEIKAKEDDLRHAEQEQRKQLTEFERVQAAFAEETVKLRHQQDEVSQRERETRSQRQNIARELRARRLDVLAEIDRRRAELELQATADDAQLRREIEDLNSKRDRLQEQVDKHVQQQDELTDKLEAAKHDQAELETRLREVETEKQERIATQASQIDNIASERNQFQESLSQAQRELSDVVHARDHLQAQVEQLDEKLQQGVSQQETTDGKFRAEMSDISEQRDALRNEVTHQQQKLDDVAARNQTLEEQLRLSEVDESEETTSLKEELAAAIVDRDRLQKDIEKSEGTLEGVHEAIGQLQQQFAQREVEVQAELQSLANERDQLRVATADANNNVDVEVKKLREENQQAQTELELAQDQLKSGQRASEDAEAHAAKLADQIDQLNQRLAGTEGDSSEALTEAHAQVQQLREMLAITKTDVEDRDDQIKSLQSQVDAASQLDPAGGEGSSAVSEQVLAERDALLEKLGDVEKQLRDQTTDQSKSDPATEDLQRRFELAIDDVRELKAQNSVLEEKLASAGESSGNAENVSDGALDWEAQKRKMLERLESDFDEEDEEEAEDRMTIEGTIRITDDVVAEKEREIGELQKLLQEQSGNIGEVAVGAAAIADLFNSDELIVQERENLTTLQAEWKEKLRKAEIDISVERAKIARERVEMENKLQALADNASDVGSDEGDVDADKKPSRGRWLTRLGLKGEEE